MKNEGSGALNFIGIIMIIFGLAYAILGTLSIVGVIGGIFPCLENQKLIIILLTYIISIIAIIGGIISIKGNYKNIQTIGIIFAIIGLVSLIYTQLTQDFFNNFDCITIVLGIGIIALATVAKEEEKKKKEKEKEKKKTRKNTKKKKSSTTTKKKKTEK